MALTIPLAYTLSIRGHGWAASLQERKSGPLVVTVAVDAGVDAGYAVAVSLADDFAWSARHVDLLKARIDFAQRLHDAIASRLAPALGELRAALGRGRLTSAAERAWSMLQSPIELSRAPELWLVSEPQRVHALGFAEEAGRVVYRVAIAGRLTLADARPAFGGAIRRLPSPSRQPPEMARSHLRLPSLVPMQRLSLAVGQRLDGAGPLATQADRFSEPVQVRIIGSSIFASQRALGLTLDLKLLGTGAGSGRPARAYLVARPTVRSEDGLVEIDPPTLPALAARDSPQPDPRLRIGVEPFAQMFKEAARLDVAPEVQAAIPTAMALLDRPLAPDVLMVARFDAARLVGVETVLDGLMLSIEVAGTLTLRLEGVREPHGNPMPAAPDARPASDQARIEVNQGRAR